jgi:hypothetical protein
LLSFPFSEVINGKSVVLQNTHRQASADVASTMKRHGHGNPAVFIPQGEVTSGLATLNKPRGFLEISRDHGLWPEAFGSFREPYAQFFHMDEAFVLRDGLSVLDQNRKVLFQCFTDVALGLFDRPSVAETPWNCRTPSEIAFIFAFFFDHDLKRVELHGRDLFHLVGPNVREHVCSDSLLDFFPRGAGFGRRSVSFEASIQFMLLGFGQLEGVLLSYYAIPNLLYEKNTLGNTELLYFLRRFFEFHLFLRKVPREFSVGGSCQRKLFQIQPCRLLEIGDVLLDSISMADGSNFRTLGDKHVDVFE